jgi:hypothetical protein
MKIGILEAGKFDEFYGNISFYGKIYEIWKKKVL